MFPGFSVTIAFVEPGRKASAQGLSKLATEVRSKGGLVVVEPPSEPPATVEFSVVELAGNCVAEACCAPLFVVAAVPHAATTRQSP
jgi:hypothetical protein